MQRVLMSSYCVDTKGPGFYYAFNFTSGGWNVGVGFTSSNVDIPACLSDGVNACVSRFQTYSFNRSPLHDFKKAD